MRYIYTHQKSRITIDADSELDAARSFKEIAQKFFPAKVDERWERETLDFYHSEEIAAKLRRATVHHKTATTKARVKPRKVRTPAVFIKPFKFE